MERPLTLTVATTDTAAKIRDTITAGDSDAYPLSITFSDLTEITGTVRFRFVRGDDYWDRDATIEGNVASLMLEPDFYAAPSTELWVSFLDSNLYTTLRVYFTSIRVPGGNVEVETSQPYPSWADDMREFDVAIGTVETLAEGESATASITGDVPDKALNLGIPVGAKGDKGDPGDAATVAVGTITTLDAGESATVANSGTSGAAVLDFGLPQGAKGDKGDPGLDGSAVPIDDASSAADRVLSASYIKGQLSAKADKVQEEWITPTLLNGAINDPTYPVQYYKDQFGVVRFRGRAGDVPNDKVLINMPLGYRPLQKNSFTSAIVARSTMAASMARLIINGGWGVGMLYAITPALDIIHFDGFSYSTT